MAKELVRQKQVELEAAIVASEEVRLLAHKMNAAGLMADNEITAVGGTWWTNEQRAGSILRILKSKVNINSSNLEKFKSILRSKSEFEDILNVLETTAAGNLSSARNRVTPRISHPHSQTIPSLLSQIPYRSSLTTCKGNGVLTILCSPVIALGGDGLVG